MAAGISRWRVLRPILVAAVALSGLAAVSRETILPDLRDALGREARNLHGDTPRTVHPVRDERTDILIGGRHTILRDRRIAQPNFVLPAYLSAYGTRLLADQGQYLPADENHPAGYYLTHVLEPQFIDQLPSYVSQGRPVIMTPQDHAWLPGHACFVATDLPFELLAGGADWRKMAGLRELRKALTNPSLAFGPAERLTIHARIVQPVLDVALVMLGLPLVMARGSRGVFASIGSCLMMVAVYYLGVALSHTMGLNLFLSPVLAAWLPVFVFVPLAAGLADPLLN
jgi:lipopolysaccharide export system permease protein